MTSNLNIIEKYIKDLNNIDSSNIKSLRLSQLKSYLKILNISYFVKDTNLPITIDIVEKIIQTTYLFNDIILTFCSCVIKASPKSNMAIIWINIWDFQNSTKGKLLINRCFNIRHYIATIRDTNMNSDISQYENCWK